MAIIGTATVEIHATLDAVREEIKKGLDEALSTVNGNIKVNVDNALANAKLKETQDQVDGLDGSEPTITPKVDDTEANAKLFAIKTKVDEFGNKTWTIKLKADTAEADAKLAATKALGGGNDGLKIKADAREAIQEFDKLGFAMSGLGFSFNIWGSTVFDKIALIGGGAAAAGGAIGGAFAALPALLGTVAASAVAVKLGFDGVGTTIKGMNPDATKAQIAAMATALGNMGDNSQTVAIQLGAMVNGPLDDLKKSSQEKFMTPLVGDFTQLGKTTIPILSDGMDKVSTAIGGGLHTAIQNVVASSPQMKSFMDGIASGAQGIAGGIPTVVGMLVNMGGAAGPAMKSVSDGINSVFTQLNNVVSQSIGVGTFTDAVKGLGPVFQGIGAVVAPLVGGLLQLASSLEGPLGKALDAIGQLIGPLIPILSSLGKNVLDVITVLAQQLTPILKAMTPLLEEFFDKLGNAGIEAFKALGPLVLTLAKAFLQILVAIEPLLGPFSTTFQMFDALGKIISAFVPVIKVFVGVMVDIVNAMTKALAPIIPVIVQLFKDFFTAITPIIPILGELVTKLIAGLAPILPTLITLLDNVIKAMLPWIPTILQILPPMLQLVLMVLPPLNGLLKFLSDNVWIVVAALGAWAAIKLAQTVNGWVGNISDFATKLSYLTSVTGEGEAGVSKFSSFLSSMGGNFKELPGAIAAGAKGVFDFAKDIGSNIASAGGTVLSFGKQVGTTIGGAFATAGSTVLDFGKQAGRAFLDAGSSVVSFAQAAGGKMLDAGKAIIGYLGNINLASAATKVWSGIQLVFNAIMDANPIALIVIGIAALIAAIVLLITHFSEVKKIFLEVWGAVSSFFEGVWNKIKSIAETVWNAISKFFEAGWKWIVGLWNTVWGGIKDFFESVWNGIKAVGEAIWNFIKAFFVTEFEIYKAIFTAVWTAIKDVFEFVWNLIKTVASTVWGWIKSFFVAEFNGFKAIFEFVWNLISTIFSTVWNAIKTVASTVWGWIKAFFTAEFDAFKAAFQFIWNLISTIFSTVWNAIKTAATAIWNAISSFFTGAFDVFKSVFQAVWNGISSFFSGIWNGIKQIASDVWNGIKGFFVTAFNDFTGFFKGIWNGISGFFGGIWDGMKTAASKAWDGLKQGVADAINWLETPVNWVIHGINKITGLFHISPIPDLPPVHFEIGGRLKDIPEYASGGSLFEKVQGGFKTNGPRAIVGEGNPMYPEYVIPTDPSFRMRAKGLMTSAARDMGMLASGGVVGSGGVTHPVNAAGVPMLGLGDFLGSVWDATGGKVVHAVATAYDDVTSWIKTKVAEGVQGLLTPLANAIPTTNIVGNIAHGAVISAEDAIISWIKGKNSEQAASGGNSQTPASRQGNVNIVQSVASGYGWGSGAEWDALVKVINRESGFNNVAQNPTSTAYGMFQFLDGTWGSYGVSKTSDPLSQATAGLRYIKGRYNDPIGAWNHEVSAGWYDMGGWLNPGAQVSINGTGSKEAIMPVDVMTNGIIAAVHAAFGVTGATQSPKAYAAQQKATSGDVNFHEGAFQVTINGNADSVTVAQLKSTLNDWNNELLYQLRGRR